ncbi:hypothetical protein NC651_016530 [Populus alba x Populus x berolinensis]|nr:hypothetical protein NC651_016530 [Populus alba x Populus x berolinensis]
MPESVVRSAAKSSSPHLAPVLSVFASGMAAAVYASPFLFSVVDFCICLLLTILGYVPGIIYALYAIVFIDRNEYFDEYRRPLYAPA